MSTIKHTVLTAVTLIAIGLLSVMAWVAVFSIGFSTPCTAAVVTAPYPGYSAMMTKLGYHNIPHDQKAKALARFAMEMTGYKQMERWPRFEFVSQERLNEIMGDGGQYRAVYQPGVMYLKEGYSIDNEPDVFVHEITHHLQVERLGLGCVPAYEYEAYFVSDAFASATGIGTVSPPGRYDTLKSLAKVQCGMDLP
jgi:hypothetical protein